MSSLPAETLEVLLTRDQLQSRVSQLAEELNLEYRDRELVVVGIMSGVVVFLADLIRGLEIPVRLEFLNASRSRPLITAGVR